MPLTPTTAPFQGTCRHAARGWLTRRAGASERAIRVVRGQETQAG
jgi:hypothetical protein